MTAPRPLPGPALPLGPAASTPPQAAGPSPRVAPPTNPTSTAAGSGTPKDLPTAVDVDVLPGQEAAQAGGQGTAAPGSARPGAATPLVVGLDPRCGTDAGYQAHRRRGESPCDHCRTGRNAERRAKTAARPNHARRDTTAERFWSKVRVGDADKCWLWTAYRGASGYGRLQVGGRGGRMEMAHRVAWFLAYGRWPAPGMHLDHLCRTQSCVNTRHLEEVTPAENARRGIAAEVNRTRQLAVTKCPQGHAYDAENTHIRPTGGRRCKECNRIAAAAWRANNPERSRETARRYRARKRGELA